MTTNRELNSTNDVVCGESYKKALADGLRMTVDEVIAVTGDEEVAVPGGKRVVTYKGATGDLTGEHFQSTTP